jgi:hypothetical protein
VKLKRTPRRLVCADYDNALDGDVRHNENKAAVLHGSTQIGLELNCIFILCRVFILGIVVVIVVFSYCVGCLFWVL